MVDVVEGEFGGVVVLLGAAGENLQVLSEVFGGVFVPSHEGGESAMDERSRAGVEALKVDANVLVLLQRRQEMFVKETCGVVLTVLVRYAGRCRREVSG